MLEYLITEEKQLKRLIETCVSELETAPEGYLCVKKRPGKTDYYHTVSVKNESGQWRQKRKYIRHENIELVKALQNKKLRTTQLRETRKRLKAVQGCRKAYKGEYTCVCSEPLKGRYGNNDVYYCKDWDEEIKTWLAQNERYNTKNI